MTIKSLGIDKTGRKIIVFHADGSGCSMFNSKDGVNFFPAWDEDLDDPVSVDELLDAGYFNFIDLPDNFPMWNDGYLEDK